MNHDPEMPGALQIIGGYVAAVVIAAATAAFAICMAERHGGPFMGTFLIGGAYIAVTGLPGFALTVFLACRHGWTDWPPFAIAGGLNALLAWYLVGSGTGFNLLPGDNMLLLASIRGGIAGGVAYWWAAYHGLSFRAVGASDALG